MITRDNFKFSVNLRQVLNSVHYPYLFKHHSSVGTVHIVAVDFNSRV